jgi:manganese transport protein
LRLHGRGRSEPVGSSFVHCRAPAPLLGVGFASILFAVALLASGLNSTVTATLAGQIVMQGFLRIRIPHWARRLLARAITIAPVVVVTAIDGEQGTAKLPILSQVVLSMQLPFATGTGHSSFTRSLRQMASFGLPTNAKDRLRTEILRIFAL